MRKRVIFAILAITPILALAQNCPLTAEEKQFIETKISSLPEGDFYSYQGFPRADWQPDYWLNSFRHDQKLEELLNPEGEVFLFRNIGGAYKKKFKGNAKRNYIEREGDAYSYSLSPGIIRSWSSPEKPGARTLVSLQNVNAQELYFPLVEGYERNTYPLQNFLHQVLALPSLESPRCAETAARKKATARRIASPAP